jgi:hypothetical protein
LASKPNSDQITSPGGALVSISRYGGQCPPTQLFCGGEADTPVRPYGSMPKDLLLSIRAPVWPGRPRCGCLPGQIDAPGKSGAAGAMKAAAAFRATMSSRGPPPLPGLF